MNSKNPNSSDIYLRSNSSSPEDLGQNLNTDNSFEYTPDLTQPNYNAPYKTNIHSDQTLLPLNYSDANSFEEADFIGQEYEQNGHYHRSFSFHHFRLDESELYKNLKAKKFSFKPKSGFKFLTACAMLILLLVLYSYYNNSASIDSNSKNQIGKTTLQIYTNSRLKELTLPKNHTFLRIIHTNDIHSKLDMFSDASLGDSCIISDIKNTTECVGGLSRAKSIIDNLRNGLVDLNDNFGSILLDAGDQLQGSYYYNYFKGETTSKTLGNHEFDEGPSYLSKYLNETGIPVVSSNMYIEKSKEKLLYDLVKPYTIIKKHNIGIIGLTTEETKWSSSAGPNINFFDPILSVNQAIQDLKSQGINKIILLSHMGYNKDKDLAAKINSGVSVVVGGHSHSFLYSGKDKSQIGDNEIEGKYPTIVNNKNWTTLIVQAKSWGEYVGVLDLVFDHEGQIVSNYTIGSPIRVTEKFKEDTEVANIIDIYRKKITNDLNVVVGSSIEDITLSNKLMKYPYNNPELLKTESPMGNLIASSIMNAFKDNNHNKTLDFAVVSSGMIKYGLESGKISKKKLITAIPYNNTVSYREIKGLSLVNVLNGVLSGQRDGNIVKSFVYFDGLRFNWTKQEQSEPQSVLKLDKVYIKNHSKLASNSVTKKSQKVDISGWSPIQMNKIYRFSTIEFLAEGGDNVFLEKDLIDIDEDLEDALESNSTVSLFDDNSLGVYSILSDYIKSYSPISIIEDGRCGSIPLF
ncbi:hypothetical protein BB561_001303 [Smittium simulii]|uniref:5'-Nucleotidase C-terminal domain-containing protein n=1 Tax=Smittium simulii TaxID=133385 RepID=A0A2T9YVD7_9FUNG|nr:hypothetical protein BB561_001303 [Smittium simulii]